MRQPQFNFEQFLDNTALNNSFTEITQSIYQIGNVNQPFFLSGVINPQNIQFGFNSNLTVFVTPQGPPSQPSITNPAACLFGNGAIATAHGTTNGTDNSTYSVNFAPLVPGAGSVTAYIVASYAQVQLDASTVLGPPPGHPDYSSNFVPYIGYNRLEATMNITATTTVPDNINNIELGRTTLTHGQTVVSSIDTTHQVLAGLNAKTVVLGGDVTGVSSANTVSNLQGKPLSVSAPAANNILMYNGSQWVAVAGTPAGGDLSGNYPNPVVRQSSAGTFNVLGNLAVTGQITGPNSFIVNAGGNVGIQGTLGLHGLAQFDSTLSVAGLISSPTGANLGGIELGTPAGQGTITSTTGAIILENPVGINGTLGVNQWANVTGFDGSFNSIYGALNIVSTGGRFIGQNAFAANQAVMLGQLSAAFNGISLGSISTAGDIYHNYFTIPIFNTNTNSFVSIILNWGFYSIYGLFTNLPANYLANVNYAANFPNGPLFVTGTLASNQGAGTGAFNGAGAAVETNFIGNSSATIFIDRAQTAGTNVHVAGPSSDGLLGFWWLIIGW